MWAKSVNCISATGRLPASARPRATPAIDDSARGVSMTRASPKRLRNPSVTRKTPPFWPTSSPSTMTRSSRSISSVRHERRAATMFISSVSPPAGGSVAGPRPRDRLVGDEVAGDRVAPVDGYTGKSVSGCALSDVLDRVLLVEGRGDRETVVLANEDLRQLVDRGEVERFVRVAFGAGS